MNKLKINEWHREEVREEMKFHGLRLDEIRRSYNARLEDSRRLHNENVKAAREIFEEEMREEGTRHNNARLAIVKRIKEMQRR